MLSIEMNSIIKKYLQATSLLLIVTCFSIAGASGESDNYNIILGRPTDKSITLSILPLKDISIYCEYKKSSENSYAKTETKSAIQGVPVIIELNNLSPNTHYMYHLVYTQNIADGFSAGEEHSFQTQRSRGSEFKFTVEADPHPYDKKGSHTLWDICFRNQLKDNPDFLLDLGDTFGDDHTPLTTTSDDMKQLHLDNRSHFGVTCNSVPLLFCLGNHEGESGYYLLQTPPNNIGITGTLWRKYYYPNPEPNDFYNGNTTVEQNGMGLPQNYYAWEWGDALFVVLDAYRYYTVSAKPRGWDWTLGDTQYNWLKQTLEKSTAKYKFVFIHHILGETRGGLAVAKTYEWGGYESNETTWGFTSNRPGWALPIHQLMVKNGVSIFFQGHDHLFAKEELDGIVYQEVPMPSDSTYEIGMLANANSYTSNQMDGSGHIRVTVSSDKVLVEYVSAYLPKDEDSTHKNGSTRFSYSVKSGVTSVGEEKIMPTEFRLEQNYPNPFNPSTIISYELPVACHVSLTVYDVLGEEKLTLVDEFQNAGIHHSTLYTQYSELSSGVYFYQLRAGNVVQTKKSVLVK